MIDNHAVRDCTPLAAGRSEDQFRNAYTFPSFHERILAPYDYYEFGQRYVRQLVDFERSV